MPKWDDAAAAIRRLLGQGADAAPTPDPAVMKYLQDMGISEQAWKTRFGFDPGDVYPADPTALQRAARLADGGAPPPVDMGIDTPLFGDMHKSAGAYDNLAKGRTPNLRNSGGNLAKIAGDTIRRADEAARAERAVADGKDFMYKAGGAAAATGLGAAIGGGLAGPAPQPRKSVPPVELPAVDSTDGTADLAAEARPVPKVAPTPAVPEPNTVQASPRDQAKALMEQLNAMRRKAGGEVPEAKYMMAEIDRLLAMSNDNRNAPGYKPDGSPGDRAQALIQQLNAMRRQAGGEVPQAAQMMAEIRRLQAEDDAARNSGRPLPAPSRTPAPAPNLSRQGVRPGYNAKPLGGKPQAPGRIGPTGGYKRRSSPSTT